MSQKSSKYTLNFKEKLFLKFGTLFIALFVKLMCISYRLVECGNEKEAKEAIDAHNGCIFSLLHQRMFYFFHYLGVQKVIVMISMSKDGELANSVASHFGVESVRGSRTRGGRSALYMLIKKLQQGKNKAVMLVDGPTGPPREVKMGTVKIARETGRPIIPVTYGAKNKIVAKSWDRYFIPVPFSKIVVLYGDPVFVPKEASKEECEQIRLDLELKMNEMTDRCDTWWGGEPFGKPGFDLPKV
jgi:lysophospholipid acyltransferase (LPLAT)-like uncharacterized protein